MQNPEYMKKVREEIKTNILDPHVKTGGAKTDKLWNILNYDNSNELNFFGYCFNESLRLEPPVHSSSILCFTEDVEVGKYKIRKGDAFGIFMWLLHRRKDIWIEPEKFIPERFDPESKYYMTPKGEKRPNYAFVPFLGGKRICLGKTFIEVVSKISGPSILSHFDFEFTSEE